MYGIVESISDNKEIFQKIWKYLHMQRRLTITTFQKEREREKEKGIVKYTLNEFQNIDTACSSLLFI